MNEEFVEPITLSHYTIFIEFWCLLAKNAGPLLGSHFHAGELGRQLCLYGLFNSLRRYDSSIAFWV